MAYRHGGTRDFTTRGIEFAGKVADLFHGDNAISMQNSFSRCEV